MPITPYKKVALRPLAGGLDVRSLPDLLPYGSFRWMENILATAQEKICRRPGFEKLLSEVDSYNNHDLHDQLIQAGCSDEDYQSSNEPAEDFESSSEDDEDFENCSQATATRQPIYTLFEAVNDGGLSRLMAATQNRIYVLNNEIGNWKIIADIYGGTPQTNCTSIPWNMAQVENTVAMTNNVDKPLVWIYDQPTETNGQSVNEIADLNELNITAARCTASWKGLLFFANLVSDGARVDSMIVWSDFRKPLSFIPAADVSLAGRHILGSGETILAMKPLGDSLLIYTTRGIWEAQVIGGDEILSFRQRYSEPFGSVGCLAYPNTLVSDGDSHYYFGKDGIYQFSLFNAKPIRVDWIHRASSVIFDELDPNSCSPQVGGYNAITKEIYFSWSRSGENCPYRTLVLNVDYKMSSIIERGFTAFVNYGPDDAASVRSFLVGNCICPATSLPLETREGGYCTEPEEQVCEAEPQSIYSSTPLVLYDGALETEDYTQIEADEDSLCALLLINTFEELCRGETSADECNAEQKFVMALSDDFCLKQYGGIYAHEINTDRESCGTYELQGYDTIIRSGPIDFRAPEALKNVRRFIFDFIAAEQTVPSKVYLRMGASHNPSDPNYDACDILWRAIGSRNLDCPSSKSAARHISEGTRVGLGTEWATFIEGRYIYWELKISGTGGSACFSGVTLDVSVR